MQLLAPGRELKGGEAGDEEYYNNPSRIAIFERLPKGGIDPLSMSYYHVSSTDGIVCTDVDDITVEEAEEYYDFIGEMNRLSNNSASTSTAAEAAPQLIDHPRIRPADLGSQDETATLNGAV